MKNTPLLALGLILCAPLGLFAQTNFSGSDDFSSDSGYWTDAGTEGDGDFAVSGGVVNFTDLALSGSGTNSAASYWNQNSGSYSYDWSVQFDATITNAMVDGESAYWSLTLASSASATTYNDYFTLLLRKDYTYGAYLVGLVFTDGSQVGTPVTHLLSSNTATLQVYYTAATNTLTAAYDADGSTDQVLWSTTVPEAWGMDSSDTFVLFIEAAHETTSTGAAITTGTFTADNFSAVPEPSTYALFGGLAVLGYRMLRRRRVA